MSGTAISLCGVGKSYGEVIAVDDVSLEIPRGQVVCLLGPNGAGKTTLIDIVLGLTPPDTGSVELLGFSPASAVQVGAIGAMLQATSLLDDATVGELIAMVSRLHKHPLGVSRTLQNAGIADLARRRSTKLSGGQRRRVTYALAIAGNPDILVLDEPTAAMDVASRHAFWASIRDITSVGKTVLFATHHLAEAEKFADRVIFIQDGRIIADGTVTEVQELAAGREISATIPTGDHEQIATLPGVIEASWRHNRVTLLSARSDDTLRALVQRVPSAESIEVAGLSLERAFLTLTAQQRKVS
ncbi:ABC transporter ATP-binding protein [Auritidibacter ignavus]|uniref:ABC transporter ATP-binding protein n=1 Tax=Auritidibacter ignavus TaxID=678932 RepID=A0AAJ6AKQ0_9MICC|nr:MULTISPECIES: ABC transporter ATP-binding protein [Auritidibacter]PXA76893.1 ABC transporter ATP-binding protein [Auritidibacter sp. NML100628]WGH94537.1 ABC transporter ATP-binding protein [Auritidibacter ignavus]